MPPSKRNVRDTIEALKAIIDESLKHPDKKQQFVDEGSIQLIIGESLDIDKIKSLMFAEFWTALMCIYSSYASYSKMWSDFIYSSIDLLIPNHFN